MPLGHCAVLEHINDWNVCEEFWVAYLLEECEGEELGQRWSEIKHAVDRRWSWQPWDGAGSSNCIECRRGSG